MLRRLAVVCGLAAVGVVAPLLDLYGKNPEVFVANRTGSGQIVVFGVAVAVVVPLVSWIFLALAGRISERAADWTYRVLTAVLSLATGLVVSRQVVPDDTLWALALTLVVGAVVFWLTRALDTLFVFAAVAIPVVLFMFLGTSATARLIWEEPEPETDSSSVGSPYNLVFLQLDEFPLASIVEPDGSINEDLFPNFARLADQGTWYRNALSQSIATTQSVPAILTGRFGEEGAGPSYVDHPDNLFTLLADSHEMHVIEWVAELCPAEICPDYAGRTPARFTNLLGDVGVVYGHLTLPVAAREQLPSIDNSWKGFLGQSDTSDGGGVEIPGLPVPPAEDRADWASWVQRLINGIHSDSEPTLSYAHLRSPHVPWVTNPSGTHYERPEEYTEVEGVEGDGRWAPDPAPALLGFQRHLYQVGFLDVMLGRLLDRIEETGTWDDTMIVVVADHGASFVPGEHRRWPYEDNRDDLYRVPLFIKYPGQGGGEVVDLPAFGIDLVPTIVDVMEVETPLDFEGISLVDLDEEREHQPMRWCCNGSGVSTDLETLWGQVERNRQWIPDQSTWLGVASAGEHGSLVGRPLASIEITEDEDMRWSLELGADLVDVDRSTGMVQTLVTGRVVSDPPPEGDEVLVAIDGQIAGVAVLSRDSASGGTFTGILAEELIPDGTNEVEILLESPDGTWISGTGDDLSLELKAPDGRVLDIRDEGNRRLQIDTVTKDGSDWVIVGWAADVSRKVTPDSIYVFAGSRRLYAGEPDVENPNVVRWFDSEDLLVSGFEISISDVDIPDEVTNLTVVAEFGDVSIADTAVLRP